MKKQLNPTIKAHLIRSAFYLLLLLGVFAIPFALAQRQNSAKHKVAAAPAHSASVPARNRVDHTSGMSLVKDFKLTSPSGSHRNPPTMTFSPFSNVHEIDLTRAGIMPIPFDMPALRNMPDGAMPDGAIVGSQNAYMATSADVVPLNTTRAEAVLFSGFTPGENVNVFFNGLSQGMFATDTNGRLGFFLNTMALEGVVTVDGIGQTSGKRAGGAFQVRASAPASPGLAMAPHAIGANGSRTFTAMGTRHQANTTINIAVNGFILFTVPSDANGSFTFSAAPAASPDGPVLFTASTATVGSLAGTSLENRADAGDGDLNVTRGFVDRPYVPSSTGGFMALSAEGFLPGETLVLSVCGSGSAPADANGALGAFLVAMPGAMDYTCVLTGATSGRVARFQTIAVALATNAPAAIASASTVRTGGPASFLFQYDRLAPSQSGTVFIDGVSQGGAGTDAQGRGMITLTAPATLGPHSVVFSGVTGDLAIAPLYVIAGTSTPTPTPTSTATATATSTATATFTPTATATSTAVFTATATFTPTATATFTPTPTPTPTSTCVRVTATAGNTGPTFYGTLKDAFDAINAGMHQGAINIDIQCDTVETASAVLNASGAPSSYTSVLIRPSGGAARSISGAIVAGSPLIDLNGADNVTIDGLNSGGNSLTISNTTASATASTSTIRLINGAQNNTITKCTVLGSSTASTTTAGGNILISTSTGGANSNNTISNNNIGPAGANLPTKGVMSLGSASPNHNTGNLIDNNNVFDFFNATTSVAGIDLQSNTATTTVSNNRIYQTAPRVFTSTALKYSGILVTTSGFNQTVTGNTVGFGAANGTGITAISWMYQLIRRARLYYWQHGGSNQRSGEYDFGD